METNKKILNIKRIEKDKKKRGWGIYGWKYQVPHQRFNKNDYVG